MSCLFRSFLEDWDVLKAPTRCDIDRTNILRTSGCNREKHSGSAERRCAVRWSRLLAGHFFVALAEALEDAMQRSGEVETVKVHDFIPHRHKVVQELLLGVLTAVDFS